MQSVFSVDMSVSQSVLCLILSVYSVIVCAMCVSCRLQFTAFHVVGSVWMCHVAVGCLGVSCCWMSVWMCHVAVGCLDVSCCWMSVCMCHVDGCQCGCAML